MFDPAMPRLAFTPRHVVDAVKAVDLRAAEGRIDPAVTRVDWLAIARRAVELPDG